LGQLSYYTNRQQPQMLQNPVLQIKWILLLILSCLSASAQSDFLMPPLAKPQKYANKTLGAEKTENKKFTLPRRLYQSTVTHYNFYFNATTKLNTIVEKARLAHFDDFTQLLPFYNYSTTVTAGDSSELDSVMYKATAGIVLHDLRNSYIDNMYLLMGQTYFYWRKFDSAYRIFQFINYNFYPKKKDEYFTVVGSNDKSTNGELNIGTKEKRGIVQKAFTRPPSRNDALLWLAKTYAEDSLYAEAYSLVNLLRKDQLFPKRLHTQLDEVQAYVFYQQEQWDSTAFYLEKALPNAQNKSELARWEYLLGQLYTNINQPALASKYYNKAKVHTDDPVLYIHARIYEAQLLKKEGENAIEQTLTDLVRMSKKERFDGFEDVLYYAAAGMALQQKDTATGKKLLQKSVSYQNQNPSVKNKAFEKLATIAYSQKEYAFASNCYDSINYSDPSIIARAAQLQTRKLMLQELVKQMTIVKQQDSLQAIAKMPEKEMDAYLKSLLRKLRKLRGLKEEPVNINPAVATGNQNQSTELFTNAGTGNSWYFYSASQKSKGFNEFKSKWGNRPNIDNWRRKAAVDNAMLQNNTAQAGNTGNQDDVNNIAEEDLSVDGLKKNLPLTPEQLLASNNKIIEALFEQGQIYKNQLEDYAQAAATFEELWSRFSNSPREQETLFELYYCYLKAGNKEKAEEYKRLLNQKFAGGEYIQKINDANNPKPAGKDLKTIVYEKIYDLFISGNFADALAQKKTADSIYGKSYWTPQLLYIESLYYIKQRQDSVAIASLNNITQSFPGTPMAEKATVMVEVLQRRKEIEDYLTNTNIVRETDSLNVPFDDGPVVTKTQQQVQKDTTSKISINTLPVQNNTNIAKPTAPVQKVTNEKDKKNNTGKITINTKPAADTTKLKPLKDIKFETVYIYNASEPYVVLMYFDEVDPIYISESKTAITRYNAGTHSGETIAVNIFEGGKDANWLDIGPYADVTAILSYMEELKQNAKQIVPWLPANKYNFVVISVRNLEILKSRKNIEEYKTFIRQHIKDKF
jgi:outer membrane protein assembly factor BamD (BamD/ComL family)